MNGLKTALDNVKNNAQTAAAYAADLANAIAVDIANADIYADRTEEYADKAEQAL